MVSYVLSVKGHSIQEIFGSWEELYSVIGDGMFDGVLVINYSALPEKRAALIESTRELLELTRDYPLPVAFWDVWLGDAEPVEGTCWFSGRHRTSEYASFARNPGLATRKQIEAA